MSAPRHAATFFFSSRRRHTRYIGDWSSDVCSSDLVRKDDRELVAAEAGEEIGRAEHLAHRSAKQIGRASCRERVEILVGAVAPKKEGHTSGGQLTADRRDDGP